MKTTPEDIIKNKAQELLRGIPRVEVYQWFALSLMGKSSPTMVTVEVENKSYVASKPKSSDFQINEEYLAASKNHKELALVEAASIIESVKPILLSAGFKLKCWHDCKWPKINITEL